MSLLLLLCVYSICVYNCCVLCLLLLLMYYMYTDCSFSVCLLHRVSATVVCLRNVTLQLLPVMSAISVSVCCSCRLCCVGLLLYRLLFLNDVYADFGQQCYICVCYSHSIFMLHSFTMDASHGTKGRQASSSS